MNNTNVATIDQVKTELSFQRETISKLLPEHISASKFEATVLQAISANADILQASRQSLFQACLKCAGDGLLPDGREAALVVYRGKNGATVSYIPMIAGIFKKIRNSGELESVASNVVHERDEFKFWVDDSGEHLEHKPIVFGQRGEAIGVYAIAKTKGGTYIEVLSKEEVESVRKASKSGQFGAWTGDFKFEMWRKTAVKRLAKRLPTSSDVVSFLKSDNDEDFDFDQLKQIELSKESLEQLKKDFAQPAQEQKQIEQAVRQTSFQKPDVGNESQPTNKQTAQSVYVVPFDMTGFPASKGKTLSELNQVDLINMMNEISKQKIVKPAGQKFLEEAQAFLGELLVNE